MDYDYKSLRARFWTANEEPIDYDPVLWQVDKGEIQWVEDKVRMVRAGGRGAHAQRRYLRTSSPGGACRKAGSRSGRRTRGWRTCAP